MDAGATNDLVSILSSEERDFLIRNNGDQIPVSDLTGKHILLYFSAHWCSPCHAFMPKLLEAYHQIKAKEEFFEVIFISSDRGQDEFEELFAKMPWLALPFGDDRKKNLHRLFKVSGIPMVVALGPTGKTITTEARELIMTHGAEVYPFTEARLMEIEAKYQEMAKGWPERTKNKLHEHELSLGRREAYICDGCNKDGNIWSFICEECELNLHPECALGEEESERNTGLQSFKSILVSPCRDYVITADGQKVSVSELEGKTIGLYFSGSTNKVLYDFTPKLVEVYTKLKEKGEDFEVVMIPLDDDKESFNQEFGKMPWFSLPFNDKLCEKLYLHFEIFRPPSLVIIGPDGRTIHLDVVESIEKHGDMAYPFTQEKLEAIDRTNREAQTLESMLVSGDLDFLIDKWGIEYPAPNLVGNHILLYFPAYWNPTSCTFMPKLVEAYHQIKSKHEAFEVILIYKESDQPDSTSFFKTMPWLALPPRDRRIDNLDWIFEVGRIPLVLALGPTGRIITSEARELILTYGAEAYPFTEARLKEIVKGWPEKVKHKLHEHELLPSQREVYICDGCNEDGKEWSFFCEECDFDLHPKCASDLYLQTLKSMLATPSRDYVISADGEKVSVSELEGKTIGLYFSRSSNIFSSEFTPKLVEVYKKLKQRGEEFEVVMIPLDDDEESFKQDFGKMPWFSLSFQDKLCEKLALNFEIDDAPTLVIIGPDGETIHTDAVRIIKEYGDMAYPFTVKKYSELKAIEMELKQETQTLESVLVSGDLDYVIGKDGIKVPVSNLIGKNILLYFSAQRSIACNMFMSLLVETYHEIKAKDEAFEVIFISDDRDQHEFEDFFSKMPWLALPFRDERTNNLNHLFTFIGNNAVVALGPTGKTITTQAEELIINHGAEAYPFTESRLKEIEANKERKGWPEKMKHQLHKHELLLSRRDEYICNNCCEIGKTWSYFCDECDFNLHPKCALKEKESKADEKKEKAKEGCFKAFLSFLTRVCFKARKSCFKNHASL